MTKFANPQFPVDLVTITEKTPNGKLHFLSSDFARRGAMVVGWDEKNQISMKKNKIKKSK